MNNRNLINASLIGAVVTTVLSAIPGLNILLYCLLCLPFWAGPLLATWYYKRQTGTLPMNHALIVGTVTGLIAGIFTALLSIVLGPITAQAMNNMMQQYMPAGSSPVPIDPATTTATAGGILLGLAISVVFGVIGGAIGGAVFKDKPTTPAPPPVA